MSEHLCLHNGRFYGVQRPFCIMAGQYAEHLLSNEFPRKLADQYAQEWSAPVLCDAE